MVWHHNYVHPAPELMGRLILFDDRLIVLERMYFGGVVVHAPRREVERARPTSVPLFPRRRGVRLAAPLGGCSGELGEGMRTSDPKPLASLRLIPQLLRRRGARVDHTLRLQNVEHSLVKRADCICILSDGAVHRNGHDEVVSGTAVP